ncbi:MAG: histidine kinase [Desulfobacterales bacterium CG23_combo_of_CG06-09_8_20_14_all_51_8]|nr:MAG: histidine kinase [Desulfobacterales bacterium CG23_combo_of_CG06-09_8_20_14_all_51_8]
MTGRIDPLGAAGLSFYSKVSASISHEIKNSLAVLNESAGFLEDLTLMAKKGRDLDINRLETLAGSMLKQVKRSDAIVKNMNRLAHSLDDPWTQTDLNVLVELIRTLSERTTVTRGFKVTAALPDSPVMAETNPFFLKNLIWLILDFAVNRPGNAKAIEIRPEKSESGARISFTGFANLTQVALNDFQTEPVRRMLELLNCRLQADENQGMIQLSFL